MTLSRVSNDLASRYLTSLLTVHVVTEDATLTDIGATYLVAVSVTEIGPAAPCSLIAPGYAKVVLITKDMEAANVATQYEQLRNERIARNRVEVAARLREAGFQDEDFSNSLFPTSRAGSSTKSSTAPALKRDRGSQHEEELSSVPRRSTRQHPARDARVAEAPKPPTVVNKLVILLNPKP